jgi:hypothetical protein
MKQLGVTSADQGAGKRRGEATLNSFVETEDDLDDIHDDRFAVLIALYTVRIGAGGTTISTSPVTTS